MGYSKADGQWANTIDVEPVASAARQANGNSGALELGDRTQLRLTLEVTAHDRTTGDETLDVTVETSEDGSGGWTTAGTFTQVAAQATPHTERLVINGVDRFYRVAWTVGGTTPDSTFSVSGEAV